MLFSLLHATRERPDMAFNTMHQWLDSAYLKDDVEYILGVDEDDPTLNSYTTTYETLIHQQKIVKNSKLVSSPRGSVGCVPAFNTCASHACGHIFLMLNDDIYPCQSWDLALLKSIADKGHRHTDKLAIHISDGFRTDDLMGIVVMTKSYYQELGYFVHPAFKGMWCDNWHTYIAKRDDVYLDCRDITFEHRHPFFGKRELDSVTAQHSSGERLAEGKLIFERLVAEDQKNKSQL